MLHTENKLHAYTSHQQTTATQWWHMGANCMHIIQQQARGMLLNVSKLHTCKLSAKQPATSLLHACMYDYMHVQCVQGCAIVLHLFLSIAHM